jgi:hypothetical protein
LRLLTFHIKKCSQRIHTHTLYCYTIKLKYPFILLSFRYCTLTHNQRWIALLPYTVIYKNLVWFLKSFFLKKKINLFFKVFYFYIFGSRCSCFGSKILFFSRILVPGRWQSPIWSSNLLQKFILVPKIFYFYILCPNNFKCLCFDPKNSFPSHSGPLMLGEERERFWLFTFQPQKKKKNLDVNGFILEKRV